MKGNISGLIAFVYVAKFAKLAFFIPLLLAPYTLLSAEFELFSLSDSPISSNDDAEAVLSLSADGFPPSSNYAVSIAPVFDGELSPKRGDIITFELPEGIFSAEVRHVSKTAQNTYSLRADIINIPYSSLYLSLTDGRYLIRIAGINDGNTAYSVKFCQNTEGHVLTPYHPSDADYVKPAEPLTPPEPLQPRIGAAPLLLRSMSSTPLDAAAPDPLVLSLMFLYTPAARDYAAGQGGIENVIAQAVEKTREAIEMSQIDLDIRVALIAEVNYDESPFSGSSQLKHLTYDSNGYMDEIHEWRELYAADLVQLFTKTNRYGGLAWQLIEPEGQPPYGFSLVRVQQADWTYTTAHEFGHNFGCHHDRSNLNGQVGIFSYSYGHRWKGLDNRLYCTVMAYDDGGVYTRLPYFSNPDIKHEGSSTGTHTENNARTIRETKAAVTRYRTHGNVKIGIEPERAGTDGAAWSPDNGLNWFFCNDRKNTSVGLAPGEHSITFKALNNWDAPDDILLTVDENDITEIYVEYTTQGSIIFSILPQDAADAGVQWSPDGEYWFDSGNEAVVGKGTYEITFRNLEGWMLSEPIGNVIVGQGETVTLEKEFTQASYLTVDIDPMDVVGAGARWRYAGNEEFFESGATVSLPEGNYELFFEDVDFWLTPESLSVELTQGETEIVEVEYLSAGKLNVLIEPLQAIDAGAEWSHDGKSSYQSGETVLLPEGTYNITFNASTYWLPPESREIEVKHNATHHLTVTFTPAGKLQASMHPQSAVDKGARWSYDGGNTWLQGGTALLPADTYQIIFDDAGEYHVPAPHSIQVDHEGTQEINAYYYESPPFTVSAQYPPSVNGALKVSITPDGGKDIDTEYVSVLLDPDSGGGIIFDGAESGAVNIYESALGSTIKTMDEGGVHDFYFFPQEPFSTAQTLTLQVSATDTGITPHFVHKFTFSTEFRRFGTSTILSDPSHTPRKVDMAADSADTIYVVWETETSRGSELYFSRSQYDPEKTRRVFSPPKAVRELAFSDNGGELRSPSLSVCRENQLYLAWEQQYEGSLYLTGAVLDPQNDSWDLFEFWPQDGLDAETIAPGLAVANNGDIYVTVLLNDPQTGNYISLMKRESNNHWVTIEEFPTTAVDSDGFALDTYNDQPYLLWVEENNHKMELLIAGSVNNWEPFTVASDTFISCPAFAMERARAHITWIAPCEDGYDAVFYRSVCSDLQEVKVDEIRVDDDTTGGGKRSPSLTVIADVSAPVTYDLNAPKVMIAWIDSGQPVSEGMNYVHFAETGYPDTTSFRTSVVDDAYQAERRSPIIISDSRGVPHAVWMEEGKVLFNAATAAGKCLVDGALLRGGDHYIGNVDDVIVELEPEDMVLANFVKAYRLENAPNHSFERISDPFLIVPEGLNLTRKARISIPYMSEEDKSDLPVEVFTFDKDFDSWREADVSDDLVYLELPDVEGLHAVSIEVETLSELALGRTHGEGVEEPSGDTEDSSGNGGSGSECFIATAVYDSPEVPEVETLRFFRDRYLLNTTTGSAAVKLYYQWGPPAAALIQHSEPARKPLRYLLNRVSQAIPVVVVNVDIVENLSPVY